MTVNKRLNLIVPFILSLLNAIALIILFWSSGRGLDLSDESYYYLGYLFYENSLDLGSASFHMVYNRFFGWGDFTLMEIRILRLLLTLISSIILFIGIKSILHDKKNYSKVILFNIILIGMLLSYTWAPIALSYNTMSSMLIAMIVGFWLLLSTCKSVSFKVSFSFILGGLFVVLFFVKITNLLLLPILAIITLYQIHKKELSKHVRLKFVLYYLLAFIFGAYIFLAFVSNNLGLPTIQQTISAYFQESFGVLSNDSTHSTIYLLTRYYENAKMVLTKLKYPLSALTIFFFLLHLVWDKFKTKNAIKGETLFKVIGLLSIILLVFQNNYWRGGTKVVYSMVIIYVYMGVFVLLNRLLEKKPIDLILILLLVGIPISGAIGTNNGLSAQVLFYGVFIFLIIYYIVSSSTNYYYKYGILTILVCLGVSQIINATAIFPYRQSKPIKSINQITGVPALTSLKVDANLSQLRKELAFLEKNEADYIYAYSAQRGMALLANKKPYSLEWFNENTLEKICPVINKSEIAAEDIIFLLPMQAPLHEEVIRCMKNKGIFFEKNYSHAKRIKYYDHYYEKEIFLNVYVPVTTKLKSK